jgi:hypothetical protein
LINLNKNNKIKAFKNKDKENPLNKFDVTTASNAKINNDNKNI